MNFGCSLAVQWLGLGAFIAEVRELKSHNPYSEANQTKAMNFTREVSNFITKN